MDTLKELRQMACRSVKETAAELCVSERTYYAYESGTRSIDVEQALKLSKFFGCTAEEALHAAINTRRLALSDNRTKH